MVRTIFKKTLETIVHKKLSADGIYDRITTPEALHSQSPGRMMLLAYVCITSSCRHKVDKLLSGGLDIIVFGILPSFRITLIGSFCKYWFGSVYEN